MKRGMHNHIPSSFHLTPPRKAILEELRNTSSHPTADQLYEAVRRRLPSVSLATVYRNLEQMSDRGIIRRLENPGHRKRFDADVAPHHHVRCTTCGAVGDVELGEVALQSPRSNFTLHGFVVHFTGLCPACADSAEK